MGAQLLTVFAMVQCFIHNVCVATCLQIRVYCHVMIFFYHCLLFVLLLLLCWCRYNCTRCCCCLFWCQSWTVKYSITPFLLRCSFTEYACIVTSYCCIFLSHRVDVFGMYFIFSCLCSAVIMVALCNRADHNIFIL